MHVVQQEQKEGTLKGTRYMFGNDKTSFHTLLHYCSHQKNTLRVSSLHVEISSHRSCINRQNAHIVNASTHHLLTQTQPCCSPWQLLPSSLSQPAFSSDYYQKHSHQFQCPYQTGQHYRDCRQHRYQQDPLRAEDLKADLEVRVREPEGSVRQGAQVVS